MLDRRQALIATLAAGPLAAWAGRVGAQTPPAHAASGPAPGDPTETIDLWPAGAPGMPATPPTEVTTERSTDAAVQNRMVTGVSRPRLAVFRPATPNGSALLVSPGGGYARMAIDHEGYAVGRFFAARGWTVFVLLYRMPGEGWAARQDTPLADAQRAMRLIRSRAARDRLRPDRIAAMGFSAGGHLCGDLATRHAAAVYRPLDAADRLSARPDIAAPIYAVQSMSLPLAHRGSRDLLLGPGASAAMETAHSTAANVTAATPPIFLVHAEDDEVVGVDNTVQMRAALKAAKVPVETHLFEHGGHGFGLRGPGGESGAGWADLFLAWARSHGLG